ncbi:MAG: biotin--[acetyl-CoA-carboxylase] ligase [Candidatus Krumholzibacteria bacterium]|nr:biotin--[acetyl-CoA-carboxylase] ligase [Candidatus Krumholzibacteria bacterium]
MKKRTGKDAAAAAGELHPARLLDLCATRHLARRIILYDSIESTNAAAMAAAAEGADGGTLFVAGEQTSGKGRKGRAWFSVKGRSLVFSLLLRPAGRTEGLTALLALAVVSALDEFLKGSAIKWPNDIFLNGKKLGGILAESRDDSAVIGLGLDVNEESGDFSPGIAGEAVSMRIACGRVFDRGIVLCRILEAFEGLHDGFQEEGFAPFREEMERRLLFIGKRVIIESGGDSFEGKMIGITNEGRLRLDMNGTERVFSSGDLTLRAGSRRPRGGSRGMDSRA